MTRMSEFPFDSERKLMSVVYGQSSPKPASPESSFPEGSAFVFCKGAPERVLSNSSHYLSKQGSGISFSSHICTSDNLLPVSPKFQEVVSQSASRMAESGLRVLALAYRIIHPPDIKNIVSSKDPKTAESDLVFVGLVGLIDPPKYATLGLI